MEHGCNLFVFFSLTAEGLLLCSISIVRVCVCVCVCDCYVSLGNLTLQAVWMPSRGTVYDSDKYRRSAHSDP